MGCRKLPICTGAWHQGDIHSCVSGKHCFAIMWHTYSSQSTCGGVISQSPSGLLIAIVPICIYAVSIFAHLDPNRYSARAYTWLGFSTSPHSSLHWTFRSLMWYYRCNLMLLRYASWSPPLHQCYDGCKIDMIGDHHTPNVTSHQYKERVMVNGVTSQSGLTSAI